MGYIYGENKKYTQIVGGKLKETNYMNHKAPIGTLLHALESHDLKRKAL